MTKKLLSDEFEKQDKVLEEVCRRHKFIVKPSWQHKWFFRYLQISLSYYFVHGASNLDKSNKRINKTHKNCLDDFDTVRFTVSAFSGVWNIDFIRWWGFIGQYQFNKSNTYQNDVLEVIRLGKKYSTKEKKIMLEKYERLLNNVIGSSSYPNYLILGMPLNESKEKLLKNLSKLIDQNSIIPQDEVAFGNFSIKKTKLKESSLRDCYRTLEIKMRNPEISLLDLAKRSGTLKTSLAGIKGNSSPEFVNTVRVGIKKQLDMAINLAENSARGLFPETKKTLGLTYMYYKLEELVRNGEMNYISMLFDKAKNTTKENSKFKSLDVDEILEHLKHLDMYRKEYKVAELKRLY